MKLHFPDIKISKILPFGFSPSVSREKLPKQLPDSFKFTAPTVVKNLKVFFTELGGAFSKEDLKRIDYYRQFYLKTILDLDEERKALSYILSKEAEEFFEPKDEKHKPNERLIQPDKVTQEFKDKVKDTTLKLFSITKIMDNNPHHLRLAPIGAWFDTNLGMPNPGFSSGIFIHPVDKAQELIGSLIKEDYEEIERRGVSYTNLSDKELQKKREKILKTLSKSFKSPKSEFAGNFSQKELEKFKSMVIDFKAINKIQVIMGVCLKDSERIKYSSKIPKDVQKGDYINGLGYVVRRFDLKLRDGNKIQAINVFSNTDGCNTFKIYNLDKLSELKNRTDTEVLKEEKEALVSEVRFSYNKNENNYYISDLLNQDTEKYPNAGMVVGLELLKLLAEKDCKPLSLRAEAYAGSSRSPVNYYRRYGFSPVTYTEKEIDKILDSNGGVFPVNLPVWFCLNDFEKLRKRIKIYEDKFFNQ